MLLFERKGGAPYLHRKEKQTHEVIMASGITRGRVRTTTELAESRKMAAIL